MAVFMVTVLMLPGVGSAQDPEPEQATSTLDDVLVTAGRVEEERRFITSNITVIYEQEITLSSATDIRGSSG